MGASQAVPTNETISEMLGELAFFSELAGENGFKVRALQSGAWAVSEAEQSVAELAAKNELSSIKGIGKGLAATIREFCSTGNVQELLNFKEKFPPSILDLRRISGLGPKKISALYHELGIGSLGELEYACQENRLVTLKGFGEKTQTKIMDGIRTLRSFAGRVLLPKAIAEAETISTALGEIGGVAEVEVLGEVRRYLETVGELRLLLVLEKDANAVIGTVAAALEKLGVTDWSEDTSDLPASESALGIGRTSDGLSLAIYTVNAKDRSARSRLELLLTASDTFLESFPSVKTWKGESEKEILTNAVGGEVPVELMDLSAKEARSLVDKSELVTEKSIRGIFHAHTTESDGSNTLEEMVEACRAAGLEYLGISDHSQSAGYAGGLKADAIRRQRDEVDKLNSRYSDFKVFQGIESDILRDGDLDYPDDVLRGLDFVIASLHGQLSMPGPEITARVCRAIENPYTTWLGHPTGRLLLSRKGAALDMERVLETAAKAKKGIELNSNPYRLDLDWRLLPRARELGIPIGIFPDAHSRGGVRDFVYGVWMARKGGLRAHDVVNTKSKEEMAQWLKQSRQ